MFIFTPKRIVFIPQEGQHEAYVRMAARWAETAVAESINQPIVLDICEEDIAFGAWAQAAVHWANSVVASILMLQSARTAEQVEGDFGIEFDVKQIYFGRLIEGRGTLMSERFVSVFKAHDEWITSQNPDGPMKIILGNSAYDILYNTVLPDLRRALRSQTALALWFTHGPVSPAEMLDKVVEAYKGDRDLQPADIEHFKSSMDAWVAALLGEDDDDDDDVLAAEDEPSNEFMAVIEALGDVLDPEDDGPGYDQRLPLNEVGETELTEIIRRAAADLEVTVTAEEMKQFFAVDDPSSTKTIKDLVVFFETIRNSQTLEQ